MTPDEAVDAAMRGPFEDSHDGERLPPPTPEVERATRAFVRTLAKAVRGIAYEVEYDAMEGLAVTIGTTGVSVSLFNSGYAIVTGPRGDLRDAPASRPLANANDLVLDMLRRVDLVI